MKSDHERQGRRIDELARYVTELAEAEHRSAPVQTYGSAKPHSWTLAEAAAVLHTSYSTLKKYRQGNELVFPDGRRIRLYTFGGRGWLVPKAALARFLQGRDD